VPAIWEDNASLQNLAQQNLPILIKKGRDSDQQLINQNTYCPPINSHVMTRALDHFR
jgi:hypothetical protein